MSDYMDVLNADERQFMTHVSRFGSGGYPVSKRGRSWWWNAFRSLSGSPSAYKTKKAAYAAVEAYHQTLLDRIGNRARELAYARLKAENPVRAAYNEGHKACVDRVGIVYNPYCGDEETLERAWRNGWKDAACNSCTRGFDPARAWVETGSGPK